MLRRCVSSFLYTRPERVVSRFYSSSTSGSNDDDNMPDLDRPPLPPYKPREGETLDTQKARLIYQSRKRGMLENDLILSTFCSKFLHKLTPAQVNTYDELINKPDNDWDIYHWIIGKTDVPDEYNTDVMNMLKEFAKNKDMEDRTRMPPIEAKN